MSNTGIQSPLGVNVVASTLLNEGIAINPVTKEYLGTSKTNDSYDPGKIVNDTSLKWLTFAINDAYKRGQPSNGLTVNNTTYDNLLNIGQSRIPALANGLPPTYLINDPSDVWQGQATSGYSISGNIGQGQDATWFPYNTGNPNGGITQWGFLRCLALQAWNVFNWQGSSPDNDEPEYKNYATQFLNIDGFIEQSNSAIFTLRNSINFLDGIYSNMNDLISGDITGVSLSSQAFGQDLINLGKVLQLSSIQKFGLPSLLLQTIKQNNSLTQSLILSLLTSGLSQNEINEISNANITPTVSQEQKIYSSFTVIIAEDLSTILNTLGCKTKNITRLSDLLNVKKMFPISYTSLTVPVYNIAPGPTNSKTYYLLFVDQELNPQLISPGIKEIVGVLQPFVEPPPTEPDISITLVEQQLIEKEIKLPYIEPKSNQTQIPVPPSIPSQQGGGGGINRGVDEKASYDVK